MKSRLRISFLVGIAALATALTAASSAAACSCIRLDVRSFETQDEAIVAKLLRVDPVGDGQLSSDYVFQVNRSFKRPDRVERGDRIRVRSATSGASCGIEQPVGSRFALLLGRQDGRWTSNLCLTTTPAAMRRLAAKADSGSSTNVDSGCSASA